MTPNWVIERLQGRCGKYAAFDIGVYAILRMYRYSSGGPWSLDQMRKPFRIGRNRFEASLRRLRKALVVRTKRAAWTGKLMFYFHETHTINLPDPNDAAGGFFDDDGD